MTTEESWKNLAEIWGNMEQVLYMISNKAGEIPRREVTRFASPISAKIESIINLGSVKLEDENDLKKFLKTSQRDRYSGINFYNIGSNKNTIEFRLANGTLDEETWIQNINLFGGIVKASEDLALIQTKPEDQRTEKEQEMLKNFEIIKNYKSGDIVLSTLVSNGYAEFERDENEERKKLEALLAIIMPEEYRDIYRERYNINNKLIEDEPDIKKGIAENIAKAPIDIKKIGKNIFLGEDSVNGTDYSQGFQIIQRDLQRDDLNRRI